MDDFLEEGAAVVDDVEKAVLRLGDDLEEQISPPRTSITTLEEVMDYHHRHISATAKGKDEVIKKVSTPVL